MNMSLQTHKIISSEGNYKVRVSQATSPSGWTYPISGAGYVDVFYADLNRWKSETAFLSDPDKITSHPSFQNIIKNVPFVLPLIIQELKNGPTLLVWALDDALDEMPYAECDRGNIKAMCEGWIAWAEANATVLE